MRRKDREVTGRSEILQTVSQAKILRLGLFDGGYPYVVPLHFGYEWPEEGLIFYLHSALEGHKLDLIRGNPRVCIELEGGVELVSGGDVPCRYGAAYSSVICRGRAEIVRDEREKIKGLTLLMQNQTGRTFAIDEKMAASVAVIKVTVSEVTAKARSLLPAR